MISQTRFELIPLLNGKKMGVELPNYCGVEDVGYIWHNTWSPAELEYKGNLINESYIEDDLLEAYREDTGEDNYKEDSYMKWIQSNTETLYDILNNYVENRVAKIINDYMDADENWTYNGIVERVFSDEDLNVDEDFIRNVVVYRFGIDLEV